MTDSTFKLNQIVFDFEDWEYMPTPQTQFEIVEKALKIEWCCDEEDLVEMITQHFGHCVKSLDYEEITESPHQHQMSDSGLIENIAEILFSDEEIDVHEVYDKLEILFKTHRQALKKKYEYTHIQTQIKDKQRDIEYQKQVLQRLEDELQCLKNN